MLYQVHVYHAHDMLSMEALLLAKQWGCLLQQLLQQYQDTWRNMGVEYRDCIFDIWYTWVYGGTDEEFHGVQGVVGSNPITPTIELVTK